MSTESPNKVECDIDKIYYPHLLLLPAGIILTILALLRRRTSFKKDIWRGRPGLVTPVSFLGLDHDRLAIVCVFGAATGSIYSVIHKGIADHGNPWTKAFLLIATAIEVAFLYYPYFGCLASYHTIIGAMMGLMYATISFITTMVFTFQKCNEYSTHRYVIVTLINIPIILCHLFILGKFILVLYKELKKYGTCKLQFFFHTQGSLYLAADVTSPDERLEMQDVLVKPWLRNYVIDLVNSKPSPRYSRTQYYLRKIYNPEKNFKFSTLTLAVLTVCSIILYASSLELVYFFGLLLDNIDAIATFRIITKNFWRTLCVLCVAAVIITTLLCVISLIRFMENHKNNMLKMFKGDKSFIPRTVNVSQFMVGKGLRYHSFQIGYFVWGYVLLLIVLSGIFFVIYLIFAVKIIRDFVMDWLKGVVVLAGIALLTRLTLPITALTIFRDPNYSKNVISIDNRNVYLVFSYFWFFVGLPMGFFSAIFRILKAMAVGGLMLTRIDHSILPDGFQWLDPGFKAYIGYVHVQAAHRNPVLRIFCQLLCDTTQNNKSQVWRCSCKARTRWFLALTLARNPQLASYRKHNRPLSMVVKYAKEDEVKIEVARYGLMQDP